MNTQTNINIDLGDFGKLPTDKVESKSQDGHAFRALKTFLLTTCLIYGLICLMFICFQNSLLYQPSSKIDSVPRLPESSFMNLILTSSDGTKINAWFVASPKNLGTVLYCRGNRGNLSNDLDLIKTWNTNGYNVLSFDYRGYGMSEGTPSEDGLYKDARAAYKWLHDKNLTERRFIIHGHSLGGGVASKLAIEYDCDGLILESTFTNLKDLTEMKFWALPTSLICFSDFPTADRLSSIKAPVFVMHSPENRRIPFKMAKQLYKAANQPKKFLRLENGDHNHPNFDLQYSRALAGFANSLSVRK